MGGTEQSLPLVTNTPRHLKMNMAAILKKNMYMYVYIHMYMHIYILCLRYLRHLLFRVGECLLSGERDHQNHFDACLRSLMLWLYREYGTMILGIVEASTLLG